MSDPLAAPPSSAETVEAWNQAPVVLGPGARFDGLLTFRGVAVVEGELSGEIIAQGTLVLGPTARVNARIEVDELISAGTTQGEVVARDRIELTASARISGELWTPRLGVADGCVVEARCHTGKLSETVDSEAKSASPAA